MSELSNAAAERAVLAGIAQFGNEAYVDIADIISTNTFTFRSNQLYYKCMEALIKENPDRTIDEPSIWTMATTLGYKDLIDKQDERVYLRGLMNLPIRTDNVRRFAGQIRKLEIGRLFKTQLQSIESNLDRLSGEESIDHIIGTVENPIFDFTSLLNGNASEGPRRIGVGIREYMKYLAENPCEQVGISTGYPYYDLAIGGGLRRKTVNLIGARPKQGKTMLGDNIALYIAGTLGIPVLNLDTEMSEEDHWNRMSANIAEVTINDIETGKYYQNDYKRNKIGVAVDKLESIPYDYLSIAGQPFEETIAAMRRWVVKSVGLEPSGLAKPCVIIYDYVKLMTSENMSSHLQEYQVLGFQMTGLHNFMVRMGVPCLAFIQLNRDGITREDTDVASGSDRLIWLCSNFSLFKEPSEAEIAQHLQWGVPCNRKLVPLVARHGAGLDSGDYIAMNMLGQYGRITESSTRNKLYKIKQKGELVHDPEIELPPEARTI